MAMTKSETTGDESRQMPKAARYGMGGALAAGAAALIVFMRSEQGKEKLQSLMGSQFGNIEEQLQGAIRENMPLIEEAIDKGIDALQQGINSLSEEINRLGDLAKERIHDYAHALPAQASETRSGS